MAITVEAKTLKPNLADNGILWHRIEVTIKDNGVAVVGPVEISEAGSTGQDPTELVPPLKLRIQGLISRYVAEKKAVSSQKYIDLATAVVAGLDLKET